MQKVERSGGSYSRVDGDLILLFQLPFLIVKKVVCKTPELESFITITCPLFSHPSLSLNDALAIYNNLTTAVVCDDAGVGRVMISLSILSKLCTTLLQIFCFLKKKRR